MVKKVHGSGGRFGARYGKSTRDKVSKIEGMLKKSKKSPFCNKNTVRRLSSGLWVCKKTGIKFTGKAYTFDSKNMSSAQTKVGEEHIDMSKEVEESQ